MKMKLLILGAALCFTTVAHAQEHRKPEALEISAVEGIYAGTFLCESGEMGMTLALKDGGPLEMQCRSGEGRCNSERRGIHELNGILHFFPTISNPNTPFGVYRVHGEVDYRIKSLAKITLKPTDWVKQPENFGASGLTANIINGNVFGKPTASGCVKFRMKKLEDVEPLAGQYPGKR